MSEESMSKYLLVRDMLALLKCSRATLYREVGAGRLPKPFRLSAGRSAWKEDEVKNLLEQRRMAANGQ